MPEYVGNKVLTIMNELGEISYVNYAEEGEGSPVYAFGHGTSVVERHFICEWKDRVWFMRGILGFPVLRDADQNQDAYRRNYVQRQIPDCCVDFQAPNSGNEVSGNWLYAMSISRLEGMEPLGYYDANYIPQYKYARITVLYEPVTYRITSDQDLIYQNGKLSEKVPHLDAANLPYEFSLRRYMTRTQKPAVEYLTVARGRYRWVEPPDAKGERGVADFAASVLQPSLEVVYTWHQVPFVPQGAAKHIGKVNRYPFTDSVRTYDPGTMLYTACDIKPYRMASGAYVQDIQYRIVIKANEGRFLDPGDDKTYGHQYFLRWKDDKLKYYKITHNGEEDELGPPPGLGGNTGGKGVPIYPYFDMRELFSYQASDANFAFNQDVQRELFRNG